MNIENDISDKRIAAVIVTFNPCLHKLENLLDALAPQVSRIMVVDNCSTNDMRSWAGKALPAALHVERLDKNIGLAAAQNMGIKFALNSDIDYLLLMDQDSIPACNMVNELQQTADSLIQTGHKVAALGPHFTDHKGKDTARLIRFQGLRLKRLYESQEDSVVKVDYLISSGCLIPCDTLRQVGLMNETLFIDYVDIDWGFRARERGFQSFGNFRALMSHSIGDKPIRFLGRDFSAHSPSRHYFMVRNAIWLYKQAYPPINWKIVDGFRLALRIGLYLLCSKSRRQHLRMILRGIQHGFTSRLGPMPTITSLDNSTLNRQEPPAG